MGMRVAARKVLKSALRVVIMAPGVGLELQAEVIWTQKLGFRRHIHGLRFVDASAEDLAALTSIASEYRLRQNRHVA